jgi:WD40 repeat protein
MGPFSYDAFVSYRRADGSAYARALRRALLDFRFPADYPNVPLRPLRIYFDTIYERATNDFFERTIKPALAQSAHLIVVRTPAALLRRSDGQPNWVEREIEYFRTLPQRENISVALAAGEWDDPLPARLGEELPHIQKVDIRHIRNPWSLTSREGVMDFIAALYDVPAEKMPALRAEEVRRRSTRLRAISGMAIAIALCLAALSVALLISRSVARRESRLAAEQSRLAAAQSRLATARQLAAESMVLRLQNPGEIGASALLALESYRRQPTAEGERALRAAAGLLIRRTGAVKIGDIGGGDLVLRPDCAVVAALSRTDGVLFFDAASGELTGSIEITNYTRIAFSSDSRWLAILAADGVLSVWDAEVARFAEPKTKGDFRDEAAQDFDFNQELDHLRAAPGNHGVYLVPMGSRVVAVDRRGRAAVAGNAVYLAEPMTDPQDAIDRHQQPVEALAFDPAGDRLATASYDGEVHLLSTSTHRLLARLRHGAAVRDVSFDAEGRLLATASADSTARIWELAGTDVVQERLRLPQDGAVAEAELSPDSRTLMTRNVGGTVRLWDATSGRELARLDQPARGAAAIGFRPGAPLAVTASGDGVLREWDLRSVAIENRRAQVGSSAFAVGFLRDGSVVALAPRTRIAVVGLRIGGGEAVFHDSFSVGGPLNPDASFLHSMDRCHFSFASSERYVACADAPDVLKLQRVGDGAVVRTVFEPRLTSCAFSPDGAALAVVAGEELRLLPVPALGPDTRPAVERVRAGSAIALSGDARLIAAAVDNHTAAVWEAATRKRVQTVRTAGVVSSVALTRDGKYVAVADNGGRTVSITEVGGGEIARLPHEGYVKAAAFDPSGRYLATATTDGEVMVWMWRPADLVARVCATLPPDVAIDWSRYLPGEPAPAPCRARGAGG